MTTRLYRQNTCIDVTDQSLPMWRLQALAEGFHFLYKGYLKREAGKTVTIVVMTHAPWTAVTYAVWRDRGMKNIRCYDLFTNRMHTGTDNP